MSIYGEPKKGDFARYVEELSRRGMASQPAAATQSPGEMPRRRFPVQPGPADTPVPSREAGRARTGQASTLAQQASLHQSSARQGFLGFVAVCLAVWNLAAYAAQEHQSPVRFIIPALIAFWLFLGTAHPCPLTGRCARAAVARPAVQALSA